MTSGHVIEDLVRPAAGTPLASAIANRADIFSLSQAAHAAALLPREPGGLSHAERAALAVRMSLLGADTELAAHYRELLARAGPADLEDIADPARLPGDPRRAALARHVDLLTREPKRATRASLAALQQAAVGTADIVRLSELIAFVNYQIRVLAGLRLMQEA